MSTVSEDPEAPNMKANTRIVLVTMLHKMTQRELIYTKTQKFNTE
jgi:hypothetical protein